MSENSEGLILAGIDEAGLGPKLGPLVVSSTALAVPENWQANSPWHYLQAAITDKKKRGEERIIVGDSKKVYAAGGITNLEKTLFAFLPLTQKNDFSCSRETFLSALGNSTSRITLEPYPWYKNNTWEFPAVSCNEISLAAKKLSKALQASGAKMLGIYANPVLCQTFNQTINSGKNKHQLVMAETGKMLQNLLKTCPNHKKHIVVDKQGGRNYYKSYLLDLFPDYWLDTIREGASSSIYKLRRDVENLIEFTPKAEEKSFCVALASITAKYLRERFMQDLNTYFRTRVPELRPTAGYPGDAKRFIAEVSPWLQKMKIPADLFVRQR